MNPRRVLHILGLLLLILAGAQLVPLVWCLGGEEPRAIPGFLAGAAAAGVLGAVMRRLGTAEGDLYRRDGVVIVVGDFRLRRVVTRGPPGLLL